MKKHTSKTRASSATQAVKTPRKKAAAALLIRKVSGQFADKSARKADAASSYRLAKDEKLDLRVPRTLKALANQASQAADETLTDFVSASIVERAARILPDQNTLVLSEENWRKFTAALDAPARPLPRLAKLFSKDTEPGA